MSAHEKPALPDPKEIAKTYAEVAQRASNLIAAHTKRQMKKGVSAPTDELGIARAFMDMMAQMLASPHKMAQAQMNLVWDYFSLWQHSMLRSMGMEGAPVAAPADRNTSCPPASSPSSSCSCTLAPGPRGTPLLRSARVHSSHRPRRPDRSEFIGWQTT